ncbi:MAG: alpha/beta hydrolase [Chlorobiaceae bacterium]|jgi:pimeloyl-ACP methyl ester carboxylesterase|nr:alpha/beta hydrolase [Chlorobiaceae bacterium]
MAAIRQNPVVIVPGVLFWDSLYEVMREALSAWIPKEKIAIAPVNLLDWIGFPPSPERSTNRVMKVLDRTVRKMSALYPGEPVTIVAHSGGGSVAMVYLLERPFQGDVYAVNGRVGRLLLLGTPFHTHEHFAKIKTDFIFRHLGREFFDRYPVVSIVSDRYKGSLDGGITEKLCYMFYRGVTEEGNLAGDGVVPAASCFLEGAENVTIPECEHLPAPHTRWYGTKEGVEQWIEWL